MLRIYPAGGVIDIDNLFNDEVIMSLSLTSINSLTVIGPTAQKIVNWVTTADGCVHTANMTQLSLCHHSAGPVESCRRRQFVLGLNFGRKTP